MVVAVAEAALDRDEPLEIMAGEVFIGHADPAMELDRLLAHEASGGAYPDFCRGNRAASRAPLLAVGRERGEDRHRLRLLVFDHHVDHAVLQGLERAEGDA